MQRARLVARLHAELVGPRDGPDEVLPGTQSPRDEYVVGAIEPENFEEFDLEAEVEDIGEGAADVDADDDEGNQAAVPCVTTISPSLTPKSLAHSIGLSFTTSSLDETEPHMSICATWGRYQRVPEGFRRHAQCLVIDQLLASSNDVFRHESGIELHVRSTQPLRGTYRVSIFIRNRTALADENRADESEFIFQPEIRVHLAPNAALVPLGSTHVEINVLRAELAQDFEETRLNSLYRNRAGFARGHLCGATWKEIDSERPHGGGATLAAAPFTWTDRNVVSEQVRPLFERADVRTMLLPLYPVQTARMDWRSEFGDAPELDPEVLSELWEPARLQSALRPLLDGYSRWINKQRQEAERLPQAQQRIALANCEQCDIAHQRMEAALQNLLADEDSRLAFLFANKAIKLQASWNNKNLKWRPFQLAFLLLNLQGISDPESTDRSVCDLLWFPTGGGKTEAYLALTAFCLALRRRRALRGLPGWGLQGGGPAVLSRYTLRLLTIQQFRRALGVLTAAEVLRVSGLNDTDSAVGWRPQSYTDREQFIWGGIRFSAGLWVGGDVTPNSLKSIGPLPINQRWKYILGGLEILQGASPKDEYLGANPTIRANLARMRSGVESSGEPAQVTECPSCRSILAIPDGGLRTGRYDLRLLIHGPNAVVPQLAALNPNELALTVLSVDVHREEQPSTWLVTIAFEVTGGQLSSRQIDEWWYRTIGPQIGTTLTLLSARPSRPGYFISTYDNAANYQHQCDFEIYCLNPACTLNQGAWAEMVPLPRNRPAPQQAGGLVTHRIEATATLNGLPAFAGAAWQELPIHLRHGGVHNQISNRIPISAFTVDEQIYHRCPSLIIATVDKFARLAYEGRAAAVFGNVDHFHSRFGFYREYCPPSGAPPAQFRPHPAGGRNGVLHIPVIPFRPPDLILQDELHLIEGPLGSLVGLYETAIDQLSTTTDGRYPCRPKYAASTATSREAVSQVQALFDRSLFQFPPPGISSDDRFFSLESETHPFDDTQPGRLYLGVCAPGRGAQTPIVRIWSLLLQEGFADWAASPTTRTDQFYTLVGYFNAIRELAGAVALARQDIPSRLAFRYGAAARQIEDGGLELSGRTSSLDLPSKLAHLQSNAPDAPSIVFSTSMFGTGVDVSRLGLMVVNGQPKNTASYIQASGRVGRENGGLVVTLLRASRPRDLDHYEYFTAYHRALSRYVEPVTVAPFSSRARERALGPLSVVFLRQARELLYRPVHRNWRVQERIQGGIYSEARRMATSRNDPEVRAISSVMERRAQNQPDGRRPPPHIVERETNSEIDRWALIARTVGTDNNTFVYSESSFLSNPSRHVVLGDAHHTAQGLQQAFPHPPQSLREVEDTTGFGT